MTELAPKETNLDKLRRLLAERKKAQDKIMLDEHYTDMQEYEESDKERHDRIMNDPSAWIKL